MSENMVRFDSGRKKCWKKNPRCDEDTRQLVEETKKEREQDVDLNDW